MKIPRGAPLRRKSQRRWLFAELIVLCACAAQLSDAAQTSREVDDIALADESRGEDWLAFGRTYSEQRFSPLTQINTSNVAELSVDWYLDLPNDRGLVSTPLVVDGVLYFNGSMNIVRAVDAATGALLWEYDPKVMERVGQPPLTRRLGP